MNKLPLLLLVGSTLFAFACKSNNPQGPGETTKTYNVSGYITTTTVGDPLSGITVRIGSRSAVTDTGGYYVVDSVAAGIHAVVPERTGRMFVLSSRPIVVTSDDVDSINFEMVLTSTLDSIPMALVPAGTYKRGVDSAYYEGFAQCFPKHQVTLTKSFWVAQFEITQEQWESVMHENNSQFKGHAKPVTHISWLQALEFCNRMSDKHGFQRVYSNVSDKPTIDWNANGYRLLTEAEFEWACAAGDTTMYHGFPDPPPDISQQQCQEIMAALHAYYWMKENSKVDGVSQPHNIGLLKPNAYGLFDMIGNAEEWVIDFKSWYQALPQVDPVEINDDTFRATRGKSYDDGRATKMNIGYYSHRKRGFAVAGTTYSRTGVRLARNN